MRLGDTRDLSVNSRVYLGVGARGADAAEPGDRWPPNRVGRRRAHGACIVDNLLHGSERKRRTDLSRRFARIECGVTMGHRRAGSRHARVGGDPRSGEIARRGQARRWIRLAHAQRDASMRDAERCRAVRSRDGACMSAARRSREDKKLIHIDRWLDKARINRSCVSARRALRAVVCLKNGPRRVR